MRIERNLCSQSTGSVEATTAATGGASATLVTPPVDYNFLLSHTDDTATASTPATNAQHPTPHQHSQHNQAQWPQLEQQQVQCSVQQIQPTPTGHVTGPITVSWIHSGAATQPVPGHGLHQPHSSVSISHNLQNMQLQDHSLASSYTHNPGGSEGPTLVFETQPEASYRYRYLSDKGSHGHLHGSEETSTPTVQVRNCGGRVELHVTLHTDEEPSRPHLALCFQKQGTEGKKGRRKQQEQQQTPELLKELIYESLGCNENNLCQLKDITILKLTRDNLQQYFHKTNEEAQQIESEYGRLDARLGVVAVHAGGSLGPVFSTVIGNSRRHTGLNIKRMSAITSPVEGDQEVYILADKVSERDIEVKMSDGLGWEMPCKHIEVFRQFLIICRTPRYKEANLDNDVEVNIYLYQPSTDKRGKPRPFTYLSGRARKRKHVEPAAASCASSNMSVCSPHSNNYGLQSLQVPVNVAQCNSPQFVNTSQINYQFPVSPPQSNSSQSVNSPQTSSSQLPVGSSPNSPQYVTNSLTNYHLSVNCTQSNNPQSVNSPQTSTQLPGSFLQPSFSQSNSPHSVNSQQTITQLPGSFLQPNLSQQVNSSPDTEPSILTEYSHTCQQGLNTMQGEIPPSNVENINALCSELSDMINDMQCQSDPLTEQLSYQLPVQPRQQQQFIHADSANSHNQNTSQMNPTNHIIQPQYSYVTQGSTTTPQMAGPTATLQMARPTATLQMAEPTATLQMARPTTTLQMARPTTTLQMAEPTATLQMARPTSTLQMAGPTTTLQMARPTTTLQMAGPTTTLQMARPTTTLQMAGPTSSPGMSVLHTDGVLQHHSDPLLSEVNVQGPQSTNWHYQGAVEEIAIDNDLYQLWPNCFVAQGAFTNFPRRDSSLTTDSPPGRRIALEHDCISGASSEDEYSEEEDEGMYYDCMAPKKPEATGQMKDSRVQEDREHRIAEGGKQDKKGALTARGPGEGGAAGVEEEEKEEVLDINDYDDEGFTALHLAVVKGNSEWVRLLLHHGARVNMAARNCGDTALHLAVRLHLPAIVQQLLDHDLTDLHAVNYADETMVDLAQPGTHTFDALSRHPKTREMVGNNEPDDPGSDNDDEDRPVQPEDAN